MSDFNIRISHGHGKQAPADGNILAELHLEEMLDEHTYLELGGMSPEEKADYLRKARAYLDLPTEEEGTDV